MTIDTNDGSLQSLVSVITARPTLILDSPEPSPYPSRPWPLCDSRRVPALPVLEHDHLIPPQLTMGSSRQRA